MYFSVFYFLCYDKDISVDVLEEKVSEERYPDLNAQEGIRMEDIREDHWRDVAEDGKYKSKIHALR